MKCFVITIALFPALASAQVHNHAPAATAYDATRCGLPAGTGASPVVLAGAQAAYDDRQREYAQLRAQRLLTPTLDATVAEMLREADRQLRLARAARVRGDACKLRQHVESVTGHTEHVRSVLP